MAGGLPVAVAPNPPWLPEAVIAGGGRVVDPRDAEALVWGLDHDVEALRALLAGHPAIGWVQLSAAGVEPYVALFGDGRVWTSAKGAFAKPVAEHALALALAGFRQLPHRARAERWEGKGGRSLFGASVTLVGGGGVAQALMELLAPFGPQVTVVRNRPDPLPGASRVLAAERLPEALRSSDLVVLATALTAHTRGMIGREQLRQMGPSCWLVNVGRGALVRTGELVDALVEGEIGGAALDVTDPEPLPEDHPLWRIDSCLITPHTANLPETERLLLSRLIAHNVRQRSQGLELEGRVNPDLGY
ncbi:MAG: hydroxyacid dehydrogenase [Candidatus Dormibacteraeota bacterium]|nr:hydroxyacid dehydrogenase [Candidatus Dormibacteraeota bacterium]